MAARNPLDRDRCLATESFSQEIGKDLRLEIHCTFCHRIHTRPDIPKPLRSVAVLRAIRLVWPIRTYPTTTGV